MASKFRLEVEFEDLTVAATTVRAILRALAHGGMVTNAEWEIPLVLDLHKCADREEALVWWAEAVKPMLRGAKMEPERKGQFSGTVVRKN